MPTIKNLLLIAMLLTLAACSKDENDGPAAPLEGVWQWVRSDGGIGHNIHDTPASTGKTIALKLTVGRQYIFYTNGVETAQGTYTLETRACIHDGQQKTVINFSGCPDQMIHTLDAGILELSDEAHDGVGSLYHRAEVSIYK